MKQFNATVLAKWQVVIPKELRDELWIDVGDSLSCFMRWSALVIKKRLQTIAYWSSDSWSHIPFGVGTDGTTLNIAIHDLQWITCLLGKPWFGKSVHGLNMMINMYTSWKSLIVFDPYGDIISEIKNHIADLWEDSIYQYVVGASNDWKTLRDTIIQDKQQKIVLISTNFQWIWAKESAILAKPILLDCYKHLVHDDVAIFIDEFANYFDEQILWLIHSSDWYTCILDQSWDMFSVDQVKLLFATINHIAIYQVSWITAKYLVDDLWLSHTIQDLRTIEKYHFYFHSSLWNKDAGKLLLGIYPLS